MLCMRLNLIMHWKLLIFWESGLILLEIESDLINVVQNDRFFQRLKDYTSLFCVKYIPTARDVATK